MLELAEAVWELWWATNDRHVWHEISIETGAYLVAVVSDMAVPERPPVRMADRNVPVGTMAFSIGIESDNLAALFVEIHGQSTHEMLKFDAFPHEKPQMFRATGWTRPMLRDSRAPIRAELPVQIVNADFLHVDECHISGGIRLAYGEGVDGGRGMTTRYTGDFLLTLSPAG